MKAKIDISGKGGLVPKFWGDLGGSSTPSLRILGEESQIADGIYNPFKRYGYLSASNNTFTTITVTGINAVIGSTFYDMMNNDAYYAEVGQEIYKGDGLNDTILTSVLDLTTTGTPRIMDLCQYEMNGKRKLYYVYEKSGNMEIGNADLPFALANNNWLTADVSGYFTNSLTNTAFMRVADNGFAYIFQDNNIHKVDGTTDGGTNGTVTQNVITFPSSFQIIDAVDYRGQFYIVIRQDKSNQYGTDINVQSQNSQLGVYVWDRLTTVIKMQDYIPLTGVKEIRNIYVSPQSDLRIITTNSERVSEIRTFTGSTFIVIQSLGYNVAPLYRDSLTVYSLITTWLGADGNIYAHGQITEKDKEALYKVGTLPEEANSTGAIMFGGDSNLTAGLYLSYTDSVDAVKVKKWELIGTSKANAGNVYTLVKYLPFMSTVNYIEIYCRPAGSGTGTIATIKPYFNQSSTAWASKAITLNETGRGYYKMEINKQYVNAIQLEIEFSTTIDLSGNTDFAPSIAIVDYTPTTTNK